MAKNNATLDTSEMFRLVRQLERVGGDVNKTVEAALKTATDKIARDTHEAVLKPNLPAQGKYSHGDTDKSIIDNASVTWSGTTASVPIGFDFAKPGAGGYLISGTPKMKPDKRLHEMYRQKKYMEGVKAEMADTVLSAIVRTMEGG